MTYMGDVVWADGDKVRLLSLDSLPFSIAEAHEFRRALDKAIAKAEGYAKVQAEAEAKDLANEIREHMAGHDRAHPDFDKLAAAVKALGLVKREK